MNYYYYFIYLTLPYLTLLYFTLLTAVEFSLGGSNSYISTDKTKKNKYT